MFWSLSFFTAVVGSSIAGLFDLKTTEIPNPVSIGMIVLGLGINGAHSLLTRDPSFFLNSASVGSAFFAFGFLMYIAGQWGGGDAKVLTGIGTLLPSAPLLITNSIFPFPLVFLTNVFIVGAAYIIVYAFLVGLKDGQVMESFLEDVRGDWKEISTLFLALAVFAVALSFVLGIFGKVHIVLAVLPGVFALFLLFKFLRNVEDTGFKKKIETDDLRAGDMLAEPIEELNREQEDSLDPVPLSMSVFVFLPATMLLIGYGNVYLLFAAFSGLVGLSVGLVYTISYRFGLGLFHDSGSGVIRGLMEEEVEKAREIKDEVVVREGVRFAPVFPAAILVSVYLGNLISYIL